MESSLISRIVLYARILLYHIKWCLQNFTNGQSDSYACLLGKTAIITGGNSGIGYATAVMLASRGCKVILACRRDATDAVDDIIKLTGNTKISTEYVDLTKLKTIREFVEKIKKSETKLDILINNAGLSTESNYRTEDDLNTVMQANYFGHFLLTHLLVDLLAVSHSARVVFLGSVSSVHHSLDDIEHLNIFGGSAQEMVSYYANSKLCSVLAGQEFAKKLRKYGIVVTCADPGMSRTPITERAFKQKVEGMWIYRLVVEIAWFLFCTDIYRAAQCSFHLATSKEIESGGYYFRCKPFIKPDILNDSEFCKNVWERTEKLVQLKIDERLT